MTFIGKFLILVNTILAVMLLAWGFSVYANSIDWNEVAVEDQKIKQRLSELSKQISAAQTDYLREQKNVGDYESYLATTRVQIATHLRSAESGSFRELFQDTATGLSKTANIDLRNLGPVVKGLDGQPLRGTKLIQADFSKEVEDSVAALKKSAQYRKDFGLLSDQIALLYAQTDRQRLLRDELVAEIAYLSTQKINWDDELLTLERRKAQLSTRIQLLTSLSQLSIDSLKFVSEHAAPGGRK